MATIGRFVFFAFGRQLQYIARHPSRSDASPRAGSVCTSELGFCVALLGPGTMPGINDGDVDTAFVGPLDTEVEGS